MSRSGDEGRNAQKPLLSEGFDPLTDRFRSALSTFEGDKPDTKDFDLGSPVSPLRTARPGSSTAITNTSSSSSSSGSITGRTTSNALVRRSDGSVSYTSHSGELCRSGESSPNGAESAGSGGPRNSRPGHRRTGSGPLIFSGGSSGGGGSSSVSSPVTNVLPAGNICPSGKLGKTGMMTRSTARSDVLGTGTGNYGHGSIVRGGSISMTKAGFDIPSAGGGDWLRRATTSFDPEEVKRAGNELYRRGQFGEALRLYDRAIVLCPENAACRCNRAAALMGMGRLGEAVKECEEAVHLDPAYGRAHQRLASLYLRLGQADDARKHLYFTGELPDPMELQKLQAIERHFSKCADVRRIGDWKSVLRESDAAISSGADSSLVLIALKAEALLHLHRLDEADSVLSNTAKLESSSPPGLQTKFLGMLSISYFHIVRARVEMALGRFDNAEVSAERSRGMDPHNREIASVLSTVKSVVKARARGNEQFSTGNFAEACLAYGEALKFDPLNPVLYCNRAICHSKLGQWEKSVQDCSEALRIRPNYTKALLRRATSYGKLERWTESVRDYEVLRKELPDDNSIAEALFHAQVALKTLLGEEVSNLKFGGEVEEVMDPEQFRAAISLPGISVVHFMTTSNRQCIQISPFLDTLCSKYPSVNFLKVDVNVNPTVAKKEDVRIFPTFKIYKNGTRVKEMICPSPQVLEYSVRHYCL